MQVLRRRIRSFFALQGILLLLIGLDSVIRPIHTLHPVPPLRHYGVLAAYLLLSVVSAMAWWTTRKPSGLRNPWAIVASLTALVTGLFYLWMQHSKLEFACTGLLVAAIGAGGLYLFAQSEAAPVSLSIAETIPAPAAAKKPAAKPTSIAGDRTHPGVNLLVAAVALFAEGTAIFYWSIWARSHGLAHAGGLPWFLLFTFAILIATFVHECGHAFLAWGCYMKLLSFNAGPLQWRKREENWQFKFNPVGFLSLGGAVRVIPTNPHQPPVHEFWTLAAGPLANVIAGQILVWMVLDHTLPFYAQTWKLAAFTASFCFIAAITNLLPFMTEDGGYSDGARILQILTSSPLNEYHRTLNSIAATHVTNRRYRDLDIAAIERCADRFPQNLRGLHLRLCASNFYEDSGRIPEAITALAAAEAIYNDFSIDLPAQSHHAFVIGHAWFNRDAAAARLWWDRMEVKHAGPADVDYFLAQAALSWVEGRPQEAQEAWQKADALAQKLPQFGAGDFDRDRSAMLRKDLEKFSPAPAARTVAATPVKASAAAPTLAAPTPAAPTPAAPTPPAAIAASVPDVDIFTRIRGLAPTPAAVPPVVASTPDIDIAARILAPAPPTVSIQDVDIAARIQAVPPVAAPAPMLAVIEASETPEPLAVSIQAPTGAIAEVPPLRLEVSPEPEPLVVVEESLPTTVAFAQAEEETASCPNETDDAIHAWLRKIASGAEAQAAAEDAIPASVSAQTVDFDATTGLPHESDPEEVQIEANDEANDEANAEIHAWLRKIATEAEPPVPANQPMPVPAFTEVDASSVNLQSSASAAAETPAWRSIVTPEADTSLAPEEPFPTVTEDPLPAFAFAEASALPANLPDDLPAETERPARVLGTVTRIPMSPRPPVADPADKQRFDPLEFLRPASGSRG